MDHWSVLIVQNLMIKTESCRGIETDLEVERIGSSSCPATLY